MAESSASYQRVDEEDPPCWKRFLPKCGVFAAVLFGALCAYQGMKYLWATHGCSPGHLTHYKYLDGEKELFPQDVLLIEQKFNGWYHSFTVQPASKEGLPKGAALGQFYRIWGPLFFTYGYEDNLGNKLLSMTPSLFALGWNHKVHRCDGLGEEWSESEGTHFFMNILRRKFSMFISSEYNIYEGGEKVAIADEIGSNQMVFDHVRNNDQLASALLQNRHYHGNLDEWFVQSNKTKVMPSFVPVAVAAVAAFDTADLKKSDVHKTKVPPSSMLIQMPQVDVTGTGVVTWPKVPFALDLSVNATDSEAETAVAMSAADTTHQASAATDLIHT